LAPGFQTSVIALATLWALSFQKWSLYETKEVLRIEEEGEKRMVAWCKYRLAVISFVMAA